MSSLRLYDYPSSGNCFKVRLLLAQLGLPYERVQTDIFDGDTLTEDYVRKNPDRTTPVLEIDGEHFLPESNAILWYLAEGTPYLPAPPILRASVVRWLLFEQARVSGPFGALRFRLQTGRLAEEDEAVSTRREFGHATLQALDDHLSRNGFLADDTYTIADIANYAYVHLAPEAGYNLAEYHAVRAWLVRIEATPGFVDDVAPFPENARPGRGTSLYG